MDESWIVKFKENDKNTGRPKSWELKLFAVLYSQLLRSPSNGPFNVTKANIDNVKLIIVVQHYPELHEQSLKTRKADLWQIFHACCVLAELDEPIWTFFAAVALSFLHQVGAQKVQLSTFVLILQRPIKSKLHFCCHI